MATTNTLPKTPDTIEENTVPLCRFLKAPFPECYCMNISSKNIRNMLLFCANNHAACSIYRSKADECRGATGTAGLKSER